MTGADLNRPVETQGRVIWITGLSGAGKTTLARALLPNLPQPRLLLDGDDMREALGLMAGGYERADRLRLARTYASLCRLAANQGQTVVCATISLFHEVQAWNRENLPGYLEVFIDAPPEVLRDRDYKQVYDRAGGAEVMGQGLAPETPLNPDVHIRAERGITVGEAVAEVLKALTRKGR